MSPKVLQLSHCINELLLYQPFAFLPYYSGAQRLDHKGSRSDYKSSDVGAWSGVWDLRTFHIVVYGKLR